MRTVYECVDTFATLLHTKYEVILGRKSRSVKLNISFEKTHCYCRSFFPEEMVDYTPGFIHAKACLIDGEIGTIGTVNLDYRSLFLHFENNSLMYQTSLLEQLGEDMADTERQSEQIIMSKNFNRRFSSWFLDGVLRIFAPLC